MTKPTKKTQPAMRAVRARAGAVFCRSMRQPRYAAASGKRVIMPKTRGPPRCLIKKLKPVLSRSTCSVRKIQKKSGAASRSCTLRFVKADGMVDMAVVAEIRLYDQTIDGRR